MPEIIDLEKDLLFSDCKSCKEPTKRVAGSTFDIEGPGVPGVIYDCDNRPCKSRNSKIADFVMRRARNEL